jgi:hypothetical protein
MKVTAKVARHGYDLRYFFETIDFAGCGSVKFVQFMAIMKDRFNLYLSPEEIESLFLYFSPEYAEALINSELEDDSPETISIENQSNKPRIINPKQKFVQVKDIEDCMVSIQEGERSLAKLIYS